MTDVDGRRRINGLTYLRCTLDIRCTQQNEQITNNSNQRTKNRHLHIDFNNVLNHN